MSQPEREASLEANCLRPEETLIKKYFEENEINDMRREFTQNSISIKKLIEKLKLFKNEVDAEIKPMAESNLYLINNIRTGFVEVNQQVYLFDDQENSMMHTYDAKGDLIGSRRLAPEERQQRIK